MTAEKRRVLRMLCKALLLVALPLAGFVWALPEDSTMLAAAAALTLASLIVGFGSEYLASSAESDLHDLCERLPVESRRRAEELEARDERLRQFDRLVTLLTEQNNSLRAKLVAVQVDVQRRKDALLDAAGSRAAAGDVAEQPRPLAVRAV